MEKFKEFKEYLYSGGFNVLVNQYIIHNQIIDRYVKDNHSMNDGKISSQSYQSTNMKNLPFGKDYYFLTKDIHIHTLAIDFNALKNWDEFSIKIPNLEESIIPNHNKNLKGHIAWFFGEPEVITGFHDIYNNIVKIYEGNISDLDELKLYLDIIELPKTSRVQRILVYPKIIYPEIKNKHIIENSELDIHPGDRAEKTYNIEQCLNRMLKNN